MTDTLIQSPFTACLFAPAFCFHFITAGRQ
jgi:hypothetical protein